MLRTIAIATLLMLTMWAVPVSAEDRPAENSVRADNIVWGSYAEVAAPAAAAVEIIDAPSRPVALPALYAGYAALQVYDIYSTRQALARGAREANPFMQGVAGNQSSFWALKAGLTVGTIVAAERLWKTNKPAAIAVMVVSNSVAAVVAARNGRVLRQLR